MKKDDVKEMLSRDTARARYRGRRYREFGIMRRIGEMPMKQIDRLYIKIGGFELEIVNAFSALSVGIAIAYLLEVLL